MSAYDIFLVTLPGTEAMLAEEARSLDFAAVSAEPGGVAIRGGRDEIARANLTLRGASRVLVRIAVFRALHLAQLDKRAHKVPWSDFLRPDVPVKVEAACHRSRIYHAGAAAERIGRAIGDSAGALVTPEAALRVMARIDDNLVTISLDTSGEPLHRRGHKRAVGKAPLRETMAAVFLRQCGYDGSEPVVDPMCGSGTFVIEAAEIAAGLPPGRSRGFAFESLAGHDAVAWAAMRADPPVASGKVGFFGHDRDDGAVRSASENAEAAGVGAITAFARQSVSDLAPPCGRPGIVMVNPPYGARIGNRKLLFGLYGAFGQAVKARFGGWRVGLVTSDGALAGATGLPFLPPGPPVPHGGLKVRLYRTGPLAG